MIDDRFESVSRPKLHADLPKTSPSEDRLGFQNFARHLARSLATSVPLEGFVVAVNGPWGSGKTTLLRLTEHYLGQETKEGRRIVVWFNPWWFSGEDLRIRFFQEIGKSLGGSGNFKELKAAFVRFFRRPHPNTLRPGTLGALGADIRRSRTCNA